MIIKFKYEKETPGTYRYKEVDDAGTPLGMDKYIIGSLYVRKDKLPNKPNDLTIEVK